MILEFLFRLFVSIYDLFTLPIYIIVQRPWVRVRKQNIIWAGPLSSQIGSPMVRYTPDVTRSHFKGKDTIDALFRNSVAQYNANPCFGTRVCTKEKLEDVDGKRMVRYDLGEYKWISYKEADATVDRIAGGLTALGLEPHSRLVIFAETRVEWMLSALACFRRAIVVCTIYATLGEEGIVHGVNETEVQTVITSEELLPKLLNLLPRLPNVKTIIYMPGRCSSKPPPAVTSATVMTFEALVNTKPPEDMQQLVPKPGDVVIIMYTSGSTGQPKGVVLTNANLVAFVLGIYSVMKDFTTEDIYIAFLPLAHSMEIAAETTFMTLGARIGYSSPLTLTDQGTALLPGVVGDVSILKPTAMVAVPLLLNRIRKGIDTAVAAKGALAKFLFAFAQPYKTYWKKRGFDTPILNRIVFKNTKLILGGRVKAIMSGSAPLSEETQSFLANCLDCALVQGYGLTETAAGATMQDKNDLTVGVAGPPLNGVSIKLVDWIEGGYRATDKPYPRGEVLIGGPTVATGYFKRPELTEELFKDDGQMRWFYSGDIGEFLPNGLLRIIDRKKDLVKLQHGEYISLGKIENALKSHPLVDNVCVYGGALSSYTVALIQPNEQALRRMAKAHNFPDSVPFAQLCVEPLLNNAVAEDLVAYCVKAGLVKFEIPLKYTLCKEVWTPEMELVTAALKIRRIQIQKFYQREIDAMYSGGPIAGSGPGLVHSKSAAAEGTFTGSAHRTPNVGGMEVGFGGTAAGVQKPSSKE